VDTFNPEAFARLKEAEQAHFWFSVRRGIIYDKIKRFSPPPAKILEVGCGTGNVSSYLSAKGYNVTGCEYFPLALELAYENFTKVRGDAFSLPFKSACFDVVELLDVIEHFDDEAQAVAEACRVTKEGGIVIVTVPAGRELWSYTDERALHRRRYTKEMAERVFSKAGLTPLLTEYMFMSLYLPLKLARRKNKDVGDYFKINSSVNSFLRGLFNMERVISKFIPLPIGTSIIAVAKKGGA
jgi:ubiquinone/menaquinone biosynthesis C-methylase UbiE